MSAHDLFTAQGVVKFIDNLTRNIDELSAIVEHSSGLLDSIKKILERLTELISKIPSLIIVGGALCLLVKGMVDKIRKNKS